MSGWKDWAIGEVVTESEFQSFVQDQVVQVYDDATDRDNTLGANVTEGMVCYLKDVNETQVYDGASWVQVGEGDITGVTAGDGLTGGGTSGDVSLDVDMTYINANASIAQSQVTDLTTDLADKADVADFTGGTEGFTAVSNGTAGLSYQPISHNYIINGAFDIWQRGDGPFTANGFTADRWDSADGIGAFTISKETFTPGDVEAIGFGDASNYLAFELTTASGFTNVNTKLEDVRTLSGQTITLSFWAKGTGTEEQIFIQQNFGSGGSATESVASGVFALTSSWTRYEFTLTLPSVSGKTIGTGSFLQVYIRNRANETYTLDIWGVQLEAGSIATPFKRNANSIQGELAACQRYYYHNYPSGFYPGDDITGSYNALAQTLNAVMVVGGTIGSNRSRSPQFILPTQMRATPTAKFWDMVGNLSKYTPGNDDGSVIGHNSSVDQYGNVSATSGKYVAFQTIAESSNHPYAGVLYELSAEL